MKDKIKELIKSSEHEDLIVDALEALSNEDNISSYACQFAWELHERLKQALTPKKRPVDMSVFVGSPIDCEFSKLEDFSEYTIGRYAERNAFFYKTREHSDNHYDYCNPRMNYRLSIDLFANDRLCGLFIEKLENAGFELDCNYFDGYLRSFKVTGLRDGFCWPWECE